MLTVNLLTDQSRLEIIIKLQQDYWQMLPCPPTYIETHTWMHNVPCKCSQGSMQRTVWPFSWWPHSFPCKCTVPELFYASYTPDANEHRPFIQMHPVFKHAYRICHDSLPSSVLLSFLIVQLKKKTLEVTVWDYDRSSSNDFLGEVSAF